MKKFTLLLILFHTSLIVSAQRYLGIATSDWSGVNGLYLNPSSIADGHQKFTIDLFSVNVGADNTLGTLNSSNVLHKFYKGDNVNINDVFKYENKMSFNMLAPYAEVRGPGFTWNIDHKNSVALTTGLRGMNQFTDISQSLYRNLLDPNYSLQPGVSDYDLKSGKFNWTAATWSQIGLSYARVILDDGKNMLKGGVTVRYLGGIGYLNAQSNNLDVHYNKAADSAQVTNTNIVYQSNVFTPGQNIQTGFNTSNLFNTFFGQKGGSGVGGDIGFTYEYRPDYDKYKYDMDGKTNIIDYGSNRYKLRVSASVLDIGAINFNNSDNHQASLTGNGYFKSGDLANNFNNYSDFRNYAKSHGFAVDTSVTSTTYHLPTAFVGSIDYRFVGNFYANATFIGNLASKNQVGNYYYNQVTLTPRYDTRIFSVGVPVTYGMMTNTMKVGLGVRVAGFFIGSDDMLALFSNNQYGFNLYFGASVPVNFKKPKDSDHDHVSNKYDKCPGVVGTWEFKGCPDPDRDHDGVPDSLDKCPDVPGSKTAMGCPDQDLDSVADAQDRCPTEAGPVALQGCPDRDHDGIADRDDACPDAAGPAKFHGCPDTDGDGIPDNEDACPDKPGSIANHGCPDTDGDGVPDNLDKCPTVPGPASNSGCPAISEEVKKRLAFAATAIQFQTGKAIIKKPSYKLLDEIVGILREYKDYYMTMDGHTDNVGKAATNLKLSRERAEAVKNYFVSKGIASDRLVTNGYGDTQPAASNKTAAGRAKNRRVAMDLKLTSGK